VSVDARGVKGTFERDGVYLARGVFDGATIDRLAADFDRIVAHSPSLLRGNPVPGVDEYLSIPTYDPERHMAFQN
jgi:hypothetical protein